jgi:hypothetical protein
MCVAASTRWIFASSWPEMGSTLRSEAWASGVAAVVVGAVAVARRRQLPKVRSTLALVAVGAGLLGAPALGAALHGVAGEPVIRTVALCFVPVLVTVMCGVWGEGSRLSFWPGLMGLAGALLVLPLRLPTDVLGWVYLVLPPVAVSVACVACRRVARGIGAEWSAASVFAGGTVCLVLIEVWRAIETGAPAQAFSVWAVVLDAVLAVAAIAVVLQVEAPRYVARYFMVPLLAVVSNVVVFRFNVGLRVGAGMVLMTAGAISLLNMRGTGGDTSELHLR